MPKIGHGQDENLVSPGDSWGRLVYGFRLSKSGRYIQVGASRQLTVYLQKDFPFPIFAYVVHYWNKKCIHVL